MALRVGLAGRVSAWLIGELRAEPIISAAENHGFRHPFSPLARIKKYANPYGKAARGTAGESAGNAFCWKSLSEKRKRIKAVQGQKRGRGERPMRAA